MHQIQHDLGHYGSKKTSGRLVGLAFYGMLEMPAISQTAFSNAFSLQEMFIEINAP